MGMMYSCGNQPHASIYPLTCFEFFPKQTEKKNVKNKRPVERKKEIRKINMKKIKYQPCFKAKGKRHNDKVRTPYPANPRPIHTNEASNTQMLILGQGICVTLYPNFCCHRIWNIFLYSYGLYFATHSNSLYAHNKLTKHLFLSSGSLISLFWDLLCSLTSIPLVSPCDPELSEFWWSVLLLLGDLALSDSGGIWCNGESGG